MKKFLIGLVVGVVITAGVACAIVNHLRPSREDAMWSNSPMSIREYTAIQCMSGAATWGGKYALLTSNATAATEAIKMADAILDALAYTK